MNDFTTPGGTTLPLLDLRGKKYLQVAHRIQWFREEHPMWSIETEITPTKDSCIAKAIVRDEKSRILATAHKTENVQGFGDFVEKSETGAIGRALSLLGYGTQFALDLDEGDRLADSPLGDQEDAVFCDTHTSVEMKVSKFNENELYCPTCKAKKPR